MCLPEKVLFFSVGNTSSIPFTYYYADISVIFMYLWRRSILVVIILKLLFIYVYDTKLKTIWLENHGCTFGGKTGGSSSTKIVMFV